MAAVVLGARVLVGLVFALSAVGKLRGRRGFDEFVGSLRPLGLLPRAWLRPVAAAVVAVEVAIPVLLAVPAGAAGTGGGFTLAALLLAVLTAGIARALRRGATVPCRCFGASQTPLGGVHIVRNLVLLAVAGAGLSGLAAGGTGPAHPAALALAGPSGLILAVVLVRLDDLVDLFGPPATTDRARPGR